MRIEWKKRSEPEFRTEPRKSTAYIVTAEPDDVVSLESLERYQINKFKIEGVDVQPVVVSQTDFDLKKLELKPQS